MDDIVRDYYDGVQRVDEAIDGTSFFPGGHGLWRGVEPHGPLPELFPENAIMFVGHNFDSVHGYRASVKRGIERVNGTTWVKLLAYIAAAGAAPTRCFFTNAFMGLQPISAVGRLKTTERFRTECREFLREQIRIVRPAGVAALGPVAADMLANADAGVLVVNLKHPYSTIRFPGLAAAEGARLKTALNGDDP